MEAKALAKNIRISAQKANLVCELIRYKKVDEAFSILDTTNKKVAPLLKKVLNAAVANATENHGMLNENLIIIRAVANEGPTIKRFRPRAKGRVDQKLKRTAHLEIVLSDDFKFNTNGNKINKGDRDNGTKS